MGRISVRVDDFPLTKDEESGRHTLKAYHEFHERLSDLIGGNRYLLGVIPGRCGGEEWNFLEESVGIEVGMHGIDHNESRMDLWQNEFHPSMNREGIRIALEQSRLTLQNETNRPVGVYMPPRNRIDRRTVDVLPAAGFHAYTAGPETAEEFRTGPHPNGLRYIVSHAPHEYGRTDEMLQRLSHEYLIARCLNGQDTVLTLHWTWQCNLNNHYSDMDEFFSKIGTNFFTNFHA